MTVHVVLQLCVMIVSTVSLFVDALLELPVNVAKLVVTLKAFPLFRPFELSPEDRFAHLELLKQAANGQVQWFFSFH